MSNLDSFTHTYALANQLLNEHGLAEQGWVFDFSKDKRTVGWCRYKEKQIMYSQYFLDNDPAEIRDTILHEIAHALVGPNHGHDATWKKQATAIGARPQRCAPATTKLADYANKPNYIIECSACLKRWKRFRLRRKTYIGAVSSCCQAPFNFYEVIHK
jgi:predicted SprT family Zn-dependent metalloprotease